MIEIQNLTKRYGEVTAVDSINFTVQKGEILGFLGPNGAGKTTTMNIITGYLPSTEGTVKVSGYDVMENPSDVKKRVGYLPEQPPLYGDMTVREYLDFVSDLKLVEKTEKSIQIMQIMDLMKLTDVQDRVIKNLSKGYKQRVGLAQSLLGNPEVLILDEPTVGLDPKQIIEIRKLIKALGKEHTIILSSHILPEVSAICDRVVIINKGKIAAIDTPENLSKKFETSSKLSVTIEGPKHHVLAAIREVEGIIFVESTLEKEDDITKYTIEVESGIDIRKPLFFSLAKAGTPILELKSNDFSLEEIFLQLTTDEKGVEE